MLEIQEGIKRQSAILSWCHGGTNLCYGLTKAQLKGTVRTLLSRWMCGALCLTTKM